MREKGKGSQAPKVARSWLRASGIEAIEGAANITVGDTMVSFLSSDEDEVPEGLSILGSEIGSPDRDQAMEAFHVMTEDLGVGKPVPVDRGPTPPRQYNQDIVLVAGRHREFRHAPDLTKDQLAFYLPIVTQSCKSFYHKNKRMLDAHGYEVEDLLTFGLMWAHIFAHKSEVTRGTRNDGKDNLRVFLCYMRQRFGAFFQELLKRAQATFPDAETAHVALTGEVMGTDTENDDPQDDLDETPRRQRREAAKLRLDERLAALPHDKMVAALSETAMSLNRDQSTRRFAAKLLGNHAESCAICLNEPASDGL